METVAVFGASSSLYRPPTAESTTTLSYTHHHHNLRTRHHQLSAFPSKCHLFSYFPSGPHAKTLPKPRIFLPHLVASLVCLLPFWSFWKLLLTHYFNINLVKTQLIIGILIDFCMWVFQEQVDETYIMVKPDGVQRGLVSQLSVLCFNLG